MWVNKTTIQNTIAGHSLREGFEDVVDTLPLDAPYFMPSGSFIAPTWRYVGTPAWHTRDGDYREYYRIVNNFEKGN